MKNKWWLGLAVMAFLLLVPFCGFAEETSGRETVNVGFFAMDGYHMMDEDGEKSGYGYDFLRLAARYLDLNYNYVGYEKSWEEQEQMLESGEVDLLTFSQITEDSLARFSFSAPIGTVSAIVTVKLDNSSIFPQDYRSYDGMRVGMLEENGYQEEFAQLAQQKQFSYTPIIFAEKTELEQALQQGVIDAAVTGSMRKLENERILESFASREFYVMVNKDNQALLNQINAAIDQMNQAEGDWKTALYDRYYSHSDDKNLTFTASEQELIRQYASGEKTLVVTASTDRAPYSYVEDGKLRGIIPDYFQRLADYIGISYQMIIPSTREELTKWQYAGTADLFIDARLPSEQWIEKQEASVTAPYTTMRLAMVTRRDFSGELGSIAVAASQGTVGIEDELAKHAARVTVATREEGMQAVLDGRVDAAFVYLYTAQEFINKRGRGLLTYTLLEKPTYEYRMVLSKQVSHEMAGILTKCIYAMPDGTFEDIAAQYTSYKAENVDLLTWLQLYPLAGICICAVLFFICLLAVLLVQRQKMVELEQRRSAELKELARQAEHANRAKSDFLSNMSHDIRTPMNAIVGIANLMAHEPELSDSLSSYIKKLQLSAQHMMGLLNDVLDMSKIEVGELHLVREPFCLTKKLEESEGIIRPQAQQRRQSFTVAIKHLTHNHLIGDGVRLQQILLNLLSNAVKYTPVGGEIQFELEECLAEENGKAGFRFLIADNGYGMSEEFLAHIYEPFVRNEASVTNKIQGTGLGMAITKNLVDQMDGEIRIESSLNRGTKVTVYLELETGTELTLPEKTDSLLAGRHFLCAEDNELNAEILEATLKLYGAFCTIYPDGKKLAEAFSSVCPEDYDAILMDIQMPNMNGYEAAKAIRNSQNPLGRTIPIIAMTANAFSEDVQRCLDSGMNAHLAKPIDIAVLEKTLRELW